LPALEKCLGQDVDKFVATNFPHLCSLPTHNTFLRSWRAGCEAQFTAVNLPHPQNYPQRDRKVFLLLPNEIRINSNNLTSCQ